MSNNEKVKRAKKATIESLMEEESFKNLTKEEALEIVDGLEEYCELIYKHVDLAKMIQNGK